MHKTKSVAPSTHDFQNEDDHRTLTRAAEVIGDKKRMAGARKHHRKQSKAMSLVQRTMLQGRGR